MNSSTTQSELDLWRRGFSSDGFIPDSCLPPGWMRKWLPSGGWLWVSPDFTVIRNQKSLVQYLQASPGPENKNVEEILNLLISNPPEKKANKNPKVSIGKGTYDFDWQEDESLPEGWKLAYYSPALATMAGARYIKLLSPAGKCLSGRTIALRHMVAQRYSQKAIDKMQSGLWRDNYEQNEFLPEGWMVRKKPGEDGQINYNFLSPNFETIRSVKKLLTYMKKNDYEEEYIKSVIFNFQKDRRLSAKKRKFLGEQLELLQSEKLRSKCGVSLRRQENRRGFNIYR